MNYVEIISGPGLTAAIATQAESGPRPSTATSNEMGPCRLHRARSWATGCGQLYHICTLRLRGTSGAEYRDKLTVSHPCPTAGA